MIVFVCGQRGGHQDLIQCAVHWGYAVELREGARSNIVEVARRGQGVAKDRSEVGEAQAGLPTERQEQDIRET